MHFPNALPISLYIHIPWCIQKCPYCDFNSHALRSSTIPESIYIDALLDDLAQQIPYLSDRPIQTIFFGGGTPSLFSGQGIERLLSSIENMISLAQNCEITLEANPGTVDFTRFRDFRSAGINRLSMGIQSFQSEKLKVLGRIHGDEEAKLAIAAAKQAGFTNFNLDLMFGLPNQSIPDALFDLETALSFDPPHLSWYQLTLEPNTPFYRTPPKALPEDELLDEMFESGQSILQAHQLMNYEVSAYAKPNHQCQHNRNYWAFGDYLGIGAGAHGKWTDHQNGRIYRTVQVKHPKDYLLAEKRRALTSTLIPENQICFEFMLNAFRLSDGFSLKLFEARTGFEKDTLTEKLSKLKQDRLITWIDDLIKPTALGKRFLNEIIERFLT